VRHGEPELFDSSGNLVKTDSYDNIVDIHIIVCTPEFASMINLTQFDVIVKDEVHLDRLWGRDFREELTQFYRKLAHIISNTGPCILLFSGYDLSP